MLQTNHQLKRLQWQCRRGMLEIDLLLKRYLSAHYRYVSVDEQAIFESFLSENDQNLFLWLTGRSLAPEKYQCILERLHP
ncbi:MAG: succinate dehydrogenase assembly factor 2 [Gammaproteobacteria bacterium]|nr:succinate dehydrogenase assembly factor 2 [Gammaproteobacteria bacterium]MCD8543170.1 succinate dehydrogenase assembly factor 2 [Gammaproteobacteria bacterium]MCD8573675.1 succinate dehydrogenase assembly factor 2 [Gammaproteobacteria bacterium]